MSTVVPQSSLPVYTDGGDGDGDGLAGAGAPLEVAVQPHGSADSVELSPTQRQNGPVQQPVLHGAGTSTRSQAPRFRVPRSARSGMHIADDARSTSSDGGMGSSGGASLFDNPNFVASSHELGAAAIIGARSRRISAGAATKYVAQLAASQLSPTTRSDLGGLSDEALAEGARIIHDHNSDAGTAPLADTLRSESKWRRFRRRLHAIVDHRFFDRLVVFLILANMCMVATWDPLDANPKSTHNRVLDLADTVFLILFTIEMLLKIVALGLYQPPSAYLRDSWNVIDCILVLLGWITYQPVGSSKVSVGRLVRVLRPLRTISHVPGLRLIINSMLASIPQLLNVLGLCAFIFFMFGIAGVQLFEGRLSQRCHFPANGTAPAVINADDTRLCSLGAGGRSCPVVGGVQTVCVQTETSVNSGITNFDNIGTAFLTIFQCITLEGWVDVMYWIDDSASVWFSIYFVSLVTFGSLFVLNLVVAVITLNLSAERTSQDVVNRANRWQELARIPEARLLVGNTTFGTADLITQLVATTYKREADVARMKRQSGNDKESYASMVSPLSDRSLHLLTASNKPVPQRSPHVRRHGSTRSRGSSRGSARSAGSNGIPSPLYARGKTRRAPRRLSTEAAALVDATLGAAAAAVAADAGGVSNLLADSTSDSKAARPPLHPAAIGNSSTNNKSKNNSTSTSNSNSNGNGNSNSNNSSSSATSATAGVSAHVGALGGVTESKADPRQSQSAWSLAPSTRARPDADSDSGARGGSDSASVGRAMDHIAGSTPHARRSSLPALSNGAQPRHRLAVLPPLGGASNSKGATTNGTPTGGKKSSEAAGGGHRSAGGGGARGAQDHMRRALLLSEAGRSAEAKQALRLAYADLVSTTSPKRMLRASDGSEPGGTRVMPLPRESDTSSEHAMVGVSRLRVGTSQRSVGSSLFGDIHGGASASQVMRRRGASRSRGLGAGAGAGAGVGAGGASLGPGTGGMLATPSLRGGAAAGEEDGVDADRFQTATQLVEAPLGGAVDDVHKDPAVVRFTDAEGNPLPGQVQRTSVVAAVANDETALVQMRLPAVRRFGPFPYSPTWRWVLWRIVRHKAFDAIILGLIVINTLALAVEHHDMDEQLLQVLQGVNLALTILFSLEMVLKIGGLGVEGYAADRFNVFDGLLVAINLLELGIQDSSSDGSGVSALRTFRLMRVFKLMRSWRSLNEIITNILKSLPRIGPFTVVLVLFMMIYSLIGMQLFGGNFGSGDALPRTHYDNLLWAFVTTFQILTGENWNEVMYLAVRERGWLCVLYFVSLVIIGTYIVLNLFLGILIDNFRQEDDENALDPSEAIVEEARLEIQRRLGEAETAFGTVDSPQSDGMQLYLRGSHLRNVVMRRALARLTSQRRMERDEAALKLKRFQEHPSAKHSSLWGIPSTNVLRRYIGVIAMHPVFEGIILGLISFSCVLLALDSQTASDGTKDFIFVADIVLTVLFTIELLLKVVAFGLVRHKGAYLRDGWNLLDATIVLFSILALVMRTEEVKVIKVIRFGRALRPLRVVKRLAGLRLVVNSVVKALPHCFHVAMLSLLLFLLFGILGVNFFGGKFYSCTDPSRTCLPRLAGDACTAAMACTGMFTNAAGEVLAREWVNPSYAGVSSYSFDSSPQAILTLFEVANLELWHEVMWKAADTVGVGWAPQRDANQYAVFYFIAFVVLASFFMLNLFVSVVVDNFNRLKHAALASPFLTPSQRKWIAMQERITRRRPRLMAVPPPQPWRKAIFHTVVQPQFELFIMGLIMLNVLVMSARSHNQPQWWSTTLDVANGVFGCVFIFEVILKIVGLNFRQYWSSNWNRFDFSVVFINVVTFVLGVSGADLGVDFTLLRAVRVVRLFRLVKTSRRLRTIFSTLYLSLPSLANVGALLLLLFFMFAIAGMSLFGTVPHGTFINTHANFEDFISAMLLLLRMSTGESWNGIMHDCAADVNRGIVIIYFTSFMLLGQFMMLNLFVAVILENFEREMEAEADSNEIKPDDLDAFAALWAKLVAKQPPPPTGKRDPSWLPAEKLAEILLSLAPPLGLHTQHRTSRSRLMKAIRVLDIPINKDGKIHYSQTLRALVRRVCGEDLPTDMDEATQTTLPHSLRILQPYLSNYSTSQLFAAKFVQLWVRSVYARRKAMSGPHHGDLTVIVRQARHLKDLDAFGKQDPYVVLWVEPEHRSQFMRAAKGKQREQMGASHGFTDTRTNGGTDCYWSTARGFDGTVHLRLDAPVVGTDAVSLWAEAWDDDVATSDDLIGMANIPIFAALAKGEDTITVPLSDSRGAGGCGELTVTIQWRPDVGDSTAVSATSSYDAHLSETAIQHLHAEGVDFQRDMADERSRRGSSASRRSSVLSSA